MRVPGDALCFRVAAAAAAGGGFAPAGCLLLAAAAIFARLLVCSRLLACLLGRLLAERDMELLDARYDFYDKSKTGTLEEDELKTLLTDLNEGIPPSKAEVREDKKNSPR